MRLHLVVGLPGSGKSHYARKLAQENGATLIDDPAGPEDLLGAPDGDIVIVDARGA